jgi:hypothetical protein
MKLTDLQEARYHGIPDLWYVNDPKVHKLIDMCEQPIVYPHRDSRVPRKDFGRDHQYFKFKKLKGKSYRWTGYAHWAKCRDKYYKIEGIFLHENLKQGYVGVKYAEYVGSVIYHTVDLDHIEVWHERQII